METPHNPRPNLRSSKPTRAWSSIRYEFLIVPAARTLQGIVLSDDIHWQLCHHFKGATRPCEDEGCEACAAKAPFKWNGYFFAMNPTTENIVVVQIPPGPFENIELFLAAHKSLRGSTFTLWRPKRHICAAVAIKLVFAGGPAVVLPKCPDIRQPLDRLFYGGFKNKRFDKTNEGETAQQTQFIKDFPTKNDLIARDIAIFTHSSIAARKIQNQTKPPIGNLGSTVSQVVANTNGKKR